MHIPNESLSCRARRARRLCRSLPWANRWAPRRRCASRAPRRSWVPGAHRAGISRLVATVRSFRLHWPRQLAAAGVTAPDRVELEADIRRSRRAAQPQAARGHQEHRRGGLRQGRRRQVHRGGQSRACLGGAGCARRDPGCGHLRSEPAADARADGPAPDVPGRQAAATRSRARRRAPCRSASWSMPSSRWYGAGRW